MDKMVKVTMIFSNPLNASLDEIGYTIMDAMAEFQSARHHNGESYVNKRYPDEQVYAGERRTEKIRQVNRRIDLAERMRCANRTIEVIDWYDENDADAEVKVAFDWLFNLGSDKQGSVASVVKGLMTVTGCDTRDALIRTYYFLKDKV